MIKNIHHIGIVVNNLDEALASFERILGEKASRVEEVPGNRSRVATFKVGDSGKLELMEPSPQDLKVYQFRESHGEGVHHICFEVDNINNELKDLKVKGVNVISEKPQPGLEGDMGMIHPKAAHRVLIELITPYSPES
jgi:methylmalonyl-CoA epimerase